MGVSVRSFGGPQRGGDDRVEADGAGVERIHLSQNKVETSLLNTLQGSCGQEGAEKGLPATR